MTTIKQIITPSLWFDRQAEDATKLYTSIFKNSKTGNITRAGKVGFEFHRMPEGTVITIEFELEKQNFIAINDGPLFKFTPSVSFLAACETKEEVVALWEKLSEGGLALMELGDIGSAKNTGGRWTNMVFPGR